MKIRIKSKSQFGVSRIEGSAVIDNVVINEDLLNPDNESASIFFKGADCSGILNMSTLELKKLNSSVSSTLSLVKKIDEMPPKQISKKSRKKRKR